jgi:hypothetical protein
MLLFRRNRTSQKNLLIRPRNIGPIVASRKHGLHGLLNVHPTGRQTVGRSRTSRTSGAQRAGDRLKGLRIDPVFLFQDSGREGAGVVAREDRHPCLG